MSWVLSWLFPVAHANGDASLREVIDSNIRNNDVMIFSKSYCPYCTKAKSAVAQQGAQFHVMELDLMSNGDDIQAELLRQTGQRTVPNIFVKGAHLGGCDNTLAAIASGKFAEMLRKV